MEDPREREVCFRRWLIALGIPIPINIYIYIYTRNFLRSKATRRAVVLDLFSVCD